MKVYIIYMIDEDGGNVCGVFSTKLKAQDHIDNNPAGDWREWSEIDEFIINELVLEPNEKRMYYINIAKNSNMVITCGDIEDWETEKQEPELIMDYSEKKLIMNIVLLAANKKDAEKEAIKIKDDWVAKGYWTFTE